MYSWTDAYSVNVEKLDDQHKQYFRLLEDMHQGMQAGQGQAMLGIVLEKLVGYVTLHFSAEEQAMRDANYPNFFLHKRQHDEFALKIAKTVKQFKAGDVDITLDLMDYLNNWLVNHIQKADKQYAPYMTK